MLTIITAFSLFCGENAFSQQCKYELVRCVNKESRINPVVVIDDVIWICVSQYSKETN